MVFLKAVSISGFLHYVALFGVFDITDLPVTFRYSAAHQLNRMKREFGALYSTTDTCF